jgi:arylsulfatase
MKRPNILLIFPDQHRGDWMPGAEGLPLRMPNLRQLMEQGTTFTRAATNSPLCVPARACLALGQDYEHCGAWNNDFCCPLDQPTFYRVLRDGGYEVSGVGKFDLHKPVMYWGEDGWLPQLGELGFTRAIENEGKGDAVWAFRHGQSGTYGRFMHARGLMDEYCDDHLRRSKDPTDAAFSDIPVDAYADNWVTTNALLELRAMAQGEKPWFLMVNFSGPHDPWDVTEEMKRAWEETDFPIPEEFSGDKSRLMAVRQNYAAMLENIDQNIGLLLEELKRLGQYDNTVIVYSADHGEMLGDRDRFFKSVPYRPSVHIPLVISGGGTLAGHVCDELVQLNDLASTITNFAGLRMPENTDARSLRPLATDRNAPPVRTHQYSALYTHLCETDAPLRGYEEFERCRKRHFAKPNVWRSVITKDYKYVEYAEDAKKELFDLRTDPGERRNIADAHPELLANFQRILSEEHHSELFLKQKEE